MESIVKIEKHPANVQMRKRVAAYARVSSGKDAMQHSLAAQVAYFSNVIQRNPEWEYAGVFADEAYTGTKESRPEFQRLLQACRAGEVDIILTKSISRFSRNTVTTIEMVRELKGLGVDVWFERENIHSLSADGEFLLTILACFAQEESHSASENQKWKIRKNFSEGIPTAINIYGYEYRDRKLVVIPEEAKVVRMIFSDYLSGMGVNAIMKKLCSLGIPTKHGGTWRQSVIQDMLMNEKYKGDMLLQKIYTIDHISKKQVKNAGQLPQYYVENAHPPIVSPEVFDAVQEALQRRSRTPKKPTAEKYPFTGKIICERCGKHFQRKTTATGIRWACATYTLYGKARCDTKKIPEDVLLGIVGYRPFQEIYVPCNGTIRVIWADGSESIHHWQNRSRSESWTDEMRREAGERKREWHRSQSQ